jgi:hypothetical protein
MQYSKLTRSPAVASVAAEMPKPPGEELGIKSDDDDEEEVDDEAEEDEAEDVAAVEEPVGVGADDMAATAASKATFATKDVNARELGEAKSAVATSIGARVVYRAILSRNETRNLPCSVKAPVRTDANACGRVAKNGSCCMSP